MSTAIQTLSLTPENPQFLATLAGQFNEHIKMISTRLHVDINYRGHQFEIHGARNQTLIAQQLLKNIYRDICQGALLDNESLHLYLQESSIKSIRDELKQSSSGTIVEEHTEKVKNLPVIQTPKISIKPRGKNQQRYVSAIRENTINFGIGPAGTGKTYLAVACAVEALKSHYVERILLVRPAVEAGEKLGFLPGDLSQKIDPYLRPLYDALYEMLGFETVGKLIEKNIIEVAPLAFMRGRTLSHAFVILDESQNTTQSQMKMFLTRIGTNSKAVITGDITQTDLPTGKLSGLSHATQVLKRIKGIHFTHFDSKDVVRHPLVQKIVEAYEHTGHANMDSDQQSNG